MEDVKKWFIFYSEVYIYDIYIEDILLFDMLKEIVECYFVYMVICMY